MPIIQTACACCGQDIEGSAREGWRDRGGGRLCLPYTTRAPGSEQVRPEGLRHSPHRHPLQLLRRAPYQIEAGTAAPHRPRPGYRWVQGWEVLNPLTGRFSPAMRRTDALRHAAQIIDSTPKD